MSEALDDLYNKHEELMNVIADASFELDHIEERIEEEMNKRQQSEPDQT